MPQMFEIIICHGNAMKRYFEMKRTFWCINIECMPYFLRSVDTLDFILTSAHNECHAFAHSFDAFAFNWFWLSRQHNASNTDKSRYILGFFIYVVDDHHHLIDTYSEYAYFYYASFWASFERQSLASFIADLLNERYFLWYDAFNFMLYFQLLYTINDALRIVIIIN